MCALYMCLCYFFSYSFSFIGIFFLSFFFIFFWFLVFSLNNFSYFHLSLSCIRSLPFMYINIFFVVVGSNLVISVDFFSVSIRSKNKYESYFSNIWLVFQRSVQLFIVYINKDCFFLYFFRFVYIANGLWSMPNSVSVLYTKRKCYKI